MRIRFTFFWLLMVLSLAACAGPRKTIYFSQPDVQKASQRAFDVHIQPLKRDNPFYVGFRLTITNKTSRPLIIDWEKTRYLFNGNDQGIFVYEGIDPESVKSGMPDETIPANSNFAKEISPLKTLGLMRGRDVPRTGQSNFFAGILPSGRNAVLLVLRQGEQEWRNTLAFQFNAK